MEKFYLFNRLIAEGDVYIRKYKASQCFDEYSSGSPISVNSCSIQLFLEYPTLRKTDYMAGIFSFPIISSRFEELLINSGVTSLEFHPVKLVCQKTKDVDDSYSFLNILDNLLCFDWERSEFETGFVRQDVVREVKKLKILEEGIVKRDMVRMAEIPSAILMSARLRTIIESAGITGVQFQRLEEFQMP